MRIDPLEQLISAAAALLLGVGVCVLYDVLRAMRRRLDSRVFTTVCDAVFCLAAFAGLFILGFTSGGGKQRIYMTAAALLGGALYFAAISRFVFPLCALLADFLAFLIKMVLLPVKLAEGFIKKIIILQKNVFHYAVKWYTINWGKKLIPKTIVYSRHLAQSEGIHNETQKGRYYY